MSALIVRAEQPEGRVEPIPPAMAARHVSPGRCPGLAVQRRAECAKEGPNFAYERRPQRPAAR